MRRSTRAALLALFAAGTLACSGIVGKKAPEVVVGQGDTPKPQPLVAAPQVTGGSSAPVQLDGPGNGPDCDQDLKQPAADCALALIPCGGSVEASNAGQGKRFDDDFYQSKYCTPQRHRYADSPEAIWAIDLPADTQADVVLHTDCVDLDLFSIRWPELGSCPSRSSGSGECEGSTRSGDDTVRITTVNRAERHLIWVDGKAGATGNFRIEVQCRTYR
jgi:hypothetical protein